MTKKIDKDVDDNDKCILCGEILKKNIDRLDGGCRGFDCAKCGDYVISERLFLALAGFGFGYKQYIPYDKEIVKTAMQNYLKSDAHDKRKSDDGENWINSTWFFLDDERKEEVKDGREYVQLNKLCENILPSK